MQTREYVILAMWAGQFANEGLNIVIKYMVKQDRPDGMQSRRWRKRILMELLLAEALGSGYGFPSSHSQYMGYFAAFLMCHLYFAHRFSSTGSAVLDALWRLVVYLVLCFWAGSVAYSRCVSLQLAFGA